MAKRQTRRSISVKGITYQRLKSWCDAQGRSCSGVLEELIKAKLDAEGVPEEVVLHERVRPDPPAEQQPAADPFPYPGRRLYG